MPFEELRRSLLIKGSPYAVVFPEPVLALTNKSLPSKDSGIDFDYV